MLHQCALQETAGDLVSTTIVFESTVWLAQFLDDRSAKKAVQRMHGMIVAGYRISVTFYDIDSHPYSHLKTLLASPASQRLASTVKASTTHSQSSSDSDPIKPITPSSAEICSYSPLLPTSSAKDVFGAVLLRPSSNATPVPSGVTATPRACVLQEFDEEVFYGSLCSGSSLSLVNIK